GVPVFDGSAQNPLRFLVHTGDLLDISVASELIEGVDILHAAKKRFGGTTNGYRFFNVAGNHDGLTFGNIADEQSDTHGLGVNRSAFVLSQVLEDPPGANRCPTDGFGFAGNEIVQRFRANDDIPTRTASPYLDPWVEALSDWAPRLHKTLCH